MTDITNQNNNDKTWFLIYENFQSLNQVNIPIHQPCGTALLLIKPF